MTFNEIVSGPVTQLGDLVIALVYGAAFFVFLFGVFRYFFFEKDVEGRKKGKQMMLWGIIGLVVLFTVWGLVKILLAVLTDWSGA